LFLKHLLRKAAAHKPIRTCAHNFEITLDAFS